MSDTVPAAATAALPTVKTTLIEGIKARLMADLADLEAASGTDLSHVRAELDAIGTDAETFFSRVEAWFKKHL